MTSKNPSPWHQDLAAAVAAAAPSVVRVHGGRRRVASGVAWTDALVLTASHAVRREEGLRIADPDGETHDAELVGRDRALDVALLRVADAGLTPASFVETGDLAVGVPTLALARPGRSIRASLRIIGVLGEDVPVHWGERIERWIETDRGLPRGFAGGPLVDVAGRALGMNTDGVVRATDLAIPTESLRRIVPELEEHGRIRHGYLGVGVRSIRLPDEVVDDVGRTHGAMVTAVEKGSPAADAGIVLGDVLFEVDGGPVGGVDQLIGVLRDRAGDHFDVRILRAGSVTSVSVTAAERP